MPAETSVFEVKLGSLSPRVSDQSDRCGRAQVSKPAGLAAGELGFIEVVQTYRYFQSPSRENASSPLRCQDFLLFFGLYDIIVFIKFGIVLLWELESGM